MIPVVSVVGWHDTGKTAFIEALVAELKRRGLRVATVKHTRGSFDIDQPGTDTWRHVQAGSDVVVISGGSKLAFIERRESELPLDDVVSRLPPGIDLVITEGYKEENKPKIEVTSKEHEGRRIASPDELVALIEQRGMAEEGKERFDSERLEEVIQLLKQRGLIKQVNQG